MLGAGVLYLMIAAGFAVHAMKTGRLYILLFVPYAGSFAYIVIELIPELFQTRGAHKVRSGHQPESKASASRP
jgi:hypothetical protein